jgi:MarR family transcriptional regulator, transcriptional regulator for hemolysin
MAREGMTSNIRNLMRTAKDARLCMEAALAEAGASYATFVILDAISLEPGLSQRQIARYLSIEGPPLTRHLDRLEAEGLVERRRDERDRRVQRVYSTTVGTRLYQALCPIVVGLEDELLAGVPPRDVEAFARVLARLHARMQSREPVDSPQS